tara:strand:- start:18953 stop:19555 length:603 start_codon:yes stop_codon:yes gene_type:complete
MKNIFAHLGRGKKAAATPSATTKSTNPKKPAAKAEGEDDPKKKDEDAAEGEDDPEKKDEDAADGEDDPEKKDVDAAEGEDDEDEAEDDPEKEKEAAFKKGVTEGRRRERKRNAAVFASPHASGREALAATLAFTTGMSADQIITTLQATPAGKSGGFAAAMAAQQNPNLGGGGGPATKAGAGSALIANAEKRAVAAQKKH